MSIWTSPAESNTHPARLSCICSCHGGSTLCSRTRQDVGSALTCKCWSLLDQSDKPLEPYGQMQLGCLHNGGCCHCGLVAALPILMPPASVNGSMSSAFAAWATTAMGATHLGQGVFTLGFCPVELRELGHGKPLLELDGISSHDLSGIWVLLCGIAMSVAESSGQSRFDKP